ncbi:MAG: cytidylate kinase-like family protein [Chloroflexota bacterium]|jgi:cytidylate kinase
MTVITLSRELGSNGTTIAREVAATLGYRFVDKSTFERILQQYGLVKFEDVYDSAPGFWARFDKANLQIISMLNKTILGIARLGDVVILGRGGYAALRDYADVLHVRIQAPFPLRVQRVMADEGVGDVEEAQRIVSGNDKARAMFVKGFYDADFYTTSQFHLVLDTGVIPIERATAWIAEAARSLTERTPADVLTTQSVDVDPILAGAIAAVLEEQ